MKRGIPKKMNKEEIKYLVENNLSTINGIIDNVIMLPKDAKRIYDAMNNIYTGVVAYINQDNANS
jgi:hypothetical protein